VVLDQLSSALDERSQIGIQRVDRVVIGFFGPDDVGREVELLDFPAGILEDEETELVEAGRPRGRRPT